MTRRSPSTSDTEQSALAEGTSNTLMRIDEDSEPRKRSVSRRLAIRIECAKAKAFRAFRFDGEYTADKTPRARRGWSTRLAVCAALAVSVTAVAITLEVDLGSETASTTSTSTDSSSPTSKPKKPKDTSDSSGKGTQAENSGGSTEPSGATGDTSHPENKDQPATAAVAPTGATGRSHPPVSPATGSTGQADAVTPSTGASATTGLDLSIHIESKAEAGTDTE